ncbi:hypothetical protein VPH35_117289 [Triticum aestivum]
MWMYSGIDDNTRMHPEEVDEEMVAQWLQGITGNKDNPRGSRRIPPLDNTNEPDKIYTEMYSMPNGEQEQEQEGEASGGDSGDWHSDGGGDEESEDSSSGEEVGSPPCSERRSKQRQDPASVRGKAIVQSAHVSKRPWTSPILTENAPKQLKVAPSKPRKAFPKTKVDVPIASGAATSGTSIYKDGDDEEMEDAFTSNAAPPNVIELPNDDEDVPQKPMGRRGRASDRRSPASKTSQSTPATEPVIHHSGDLNRASVTFAVPVSSERPSSLTAQVPVSSVRLHASDPQAAVVDLPSPLFTTHHVPEDQVGAAKEAIRQAGLMMEQMKVVHEASQAAYDASSALQANVQAQEKTTPADQKLALVGRLEEENAKLKTALDKANKEVTRLKKDKGALTDKVGDLSRRRDELEVYLGGLAKKLFLMLEEFCQNFEEETGRIETSLDPINFPVKDEAAMNVLQLESRLASVTDYLARLKIAVSRIDTALWPRETLQNNLEALMTRLNEIPGRVQEWKKSSARCGADVALSLVHVHCREAKEENLAAIKVANTKKLDF